MPKKFLQTDKRTIYCSKRYMHLKTCKSALFSWQTLTHFTCTTFLIKSRIFTGKIRSSVHVMYYNLRVLRHKKNFGFVFKFLPFDGNDDTKNVDVRTYFILLFSRMLAPHISLFTAKNAFTANLFHVQFCVLS